MKDYTIYVTEDIAEKAKKKGCPLQKVYEQYTGQPPIFYTLPDKDPKWIYCDAYYYPTAEQICGWLREEKKISICCFPIKPYEIIKWRYVVEYSDNFDNEVTDIKDTYEEALLEGINKALELI